MTIDVTQTRNIIEKIKIYSKRYLHPAQLDLPVNIRNFKMSFIFIRK